MTRKAISVTQWFLKKEAHLSRIPKIRAVPNVARTAHTHFHQSVHSLRKQAQERLQRRSWRASVHLDITEGPVDAKMSLI